MLVGGDLRISMPDAEAKIDDVAEEIIFEAMIKARRLEQITAVRRQFVIRGGVTLAKKEAEEKKKKEAAGRRAANGNDGA